MDAPFPEGLVEDMERLARDDDEPPGLDSYEAVFAAPLVFPLQRKRELEAMMRAAREVAPRIVVEIGADKGGGCYHWLKGLELRRFCGIEIRGVPYAAALEKAFPWIDQLWLAESSFAAATVATVGRWLGSEEIDVLFIDGDKTHFFVDFMAYLPLVRPGGLVLMHDIQDPAPRAAFEQAARHPRVRASRQIIDTAEVQEALQREQAGASPANPHEGWLRWWKGRSCGVGLLWC